MKYKYLFLILLSNIAPTFTFAETKSYANFTGHWIATDGKVSSNVGLNSNCKKVEIIIEQNENEILTKLYNAECSLYGSKWGLIKQTIRDGKIFEGEDEVGTITDDTLITVSTSGGYQYAYNLKFITLTNGQKILKSYYGTKSFIGAIATEANHQLAP